MIGVIGRTRNTVSVTVTVTATVTVIAAAADTVASPLETTQVDVVEGQAVAAGCWWACIRKEIVLMEKAA